MNSGQIPVRRATMPLEAIRGVGVVSAPTKTRTATVEAVT